LKTPRKKFKMVADEIIGTNDNDSVVKYLIGKTKDEK